MRGRVASVLVATALVALTACSTGNRSTTSPRPTPTAGVPSDAASLPTTALPAVKKPNILVIEADDMRTDDLLFMPSVRRLIADRGLSFVNSFAPYPLCCPSRASFLSGEYAHNHGVLKVTDPFGFQAFDDSTTIATVLQSAGYQTGLDGKYLNGYGQQPIHSTDKPSVDYVPPGWTRWFGALDKHWPAGSPLSGGTYRYYAMTQNQDGTPTAHTGVYSTDLVGDQTRGLIRSLGKDAKPWFIWSTPIAPHYGAPHERDDPGPVRSDSGGREIFLTPARPVWVRGIFDKTITHPWGEPPHGPVEADMSDKPGFMRRWPETNAAEKKVILNLSRQRAESLYVLDRQVAKTMVELHRTGQWDNTIVVFTSDNGYYLGEHRKRQGKTLVHEPSLRVPFLIAGPGVPRGVRYDPISTVDLAPTFAAYAGTTMPRTDGHSLLDVIEHGDRGWTTPVVTEGDFDKVPESHRLPEFKTALNLRGIRTARWKFTEYATGEMELYDLRKDPLELTGLQDDPAYAGVLARMKRLWETYYNCREAACDRPLPAWASATAAQERQWTDHEFAAYATYYDHPYVKK